MSSTEPEPVKAHATNSSIVRSLLRSMRWMIHPVTVFVGLQILWVLVIVLWVVWFFERQEQFLEFARILGSPSQDSSMGFWSLVIGIVLLVLILIGVVFLFVVAIRQVALNRQQRSFVSSVTHELRSPLASLRLLLETLRLRKVDPATQDKMHGMMELDTERLVRLVDRILVSSRLDRGILTLGSPEVIKVNELVGAVIGQLQHADSGLQARIRIDLPECLTIRTIMPALALIISNLIENAIKYSPAGTPIEIRGNAKEGMFTLEVLDEGYGLSRTERRRIFRMFYRSGDAIKKAIPGTGLGLYIVRETARVLGGQVTADSRGPGKGAIFTLILPAMEGGH